MVCICKIVCQCWYSSKLKSLRHLRHIPFCDLALGHLVFIAFLSSYFYFCVLIFFTFQLNMFEEKSIILLTLVLMTIKRLDAYAYTIIVVMIYNQQNVILKIICLSYYKKRTNGDNTEGRINKKKNQIWETPSR